MLFNKWRDKRSNIINESYKIIKWMSIEIENNEKIENQDKRKTTKRINKE